MLSFPGKFLGLSNKDGREGNHAPMRVPSFFVHYCIFFVSVLNSFLFDVGWGVRIRYKLIKSDDFLFFRSCLRLFTVDGHKITEPSQLDSNGQYVAVGRERLYVLFLLIIFRQYLFYLCIFIRIFTFISFIYL